MCACAAWSGSEPRNRTLCNALRDPTLEALNGGIHGGIHGDPTTKSILQDSDSVRMSNLEKHPWLIFPKALVLLPPFYKHPLAMLQHCFSGPSKQPVI